MIGAAAVVLMLFSGRIAGISGIVSRFIAPVPDSKPLQALTFVIGLIIAPLLWESVLGKSVDQTVTSNLPLAVFAGLLVGFGTAYGSGCTSGHGVCGLSRFSKRSLVATLTFMATAILLVFVARHLVGAGL